MSDEVTVHELLILETLGFDVIVEHPHPYVVKCIQLIRGRATCAYIHIYVHAGMHTYANKHWGARERR